jgi:hypothetical protein
VEARVGVGEAGADGGGGRDAPVGAAGGERLDRDPGGVERAAGAVDGALEGPGERCEGALAGVADVAAVGDANRLAVSPAASSARCTADVPAWSGATSWPGPRSTGNSAAAVATLVSSAVAWSSAPLPRAVEAATVGRPEPPPTAIVTENPSTGSTSCCPTASSRVLRLVVCARTVSVVDGWSAPAVSLT